MQRFPRSTKTELATEKRSGAALVLSLVLVLVCATLGAAFTQFASSTARRQSHAVAQLQAFYVAEAGLAESFYAVRMGRTGRIADESAPARYGGADVWVESSEASDGTLFIRSTARRGRSDAALGLIVRPEPPPLGFFAVEDLVVEDVILVDGFDSTERSYAEEVASIEAALAGLHEAEHGSYSPEEIATFENARSLRPFFDAALGREVFEAVLADQISIRTQSGLLGLLTLGLLGSDEEVYILEHSPHDLRQLLSQEDYDHFVANGRDIYDTYLAGHLFDDDPLVPGFEGTTSLLESMLRPGGWSGLAPTAPERFAPHTLHGALLGSDGDVVFGSSAVGAEIHGSVVPGPDGTVSGLPEGAITGSTAPRALPAHLPEVEVPRLVSNGDLTVADGLPLVLSSPSARYGRIEVAPNEDLCLRGPMVLVVDDFVMADGARLDLDTSGGEVEIFVRSSMSLHPASTVQTVAATSRDVSIRAETGIAGTSLDMQAAGAFSGTIYAPDAEVTVGTNFEVFGGIVARRLVLQAGARLHFDHESYDGELAVPRMEAWRILELPPAETGGARASSGLSASLGALHDTDHVQVDIAYVDHGGVARTYSGDESAFDYTQVASVDHVRRDLDHEALREEAEPEWMAKWRSWSAEGVSVEDILNDIFSALAAAED